MAVLTSAGFWVLSFVISASQFSSALITYFRFGSPPDTVHIPRAQLFAMYVHQLPRLLALGGWSLITGASLALGVMRYPVGRGAGILALAAGAFMYVSAVPFTKTFGFYALETPLIHWLLLALYSLAMPWFLGRGISRLSA